MKKNNGRRKARQQSKKSRKPAVARAQATAPAAAPAAAAKPALRRAQVSQQPAVASGAGRRRARGGVVAALGRVDWAAVAIVVLPLVVLTLLEFGLRGARIATLEPWRGELALEAMPVVRDVRSRVRIVTVEPPLSPWQGELALEDMPVMPDVRSRRATVVSVEPPPVPWRGDLAFEDMPLQPDPPGRLPRAPLIGEAMAAAAAAPICLHDEPTPSAVSNAPQDPLAFGRALAQAARAQTDRFVIYNPRYMTIAYPRGDTLPLYGVCTDVVVRAYRALGLDLQELIHTSRLGSGDPSIDHRRVEVVRRFFERYGTSFEISEFAEDFLPGDIVTYRRPEGRVSQYHIAVVSDRVAPSGRPLIVHNRGWGPQLEDALFVDRMTGHYRFAPRDAEAFVRSRPPRAVERHRTADVTPKRR